MNISDKVYNFKTKNKEGFIWPEINLLLKDYPLVDMKKFNDALMGVTCIMDEKTHETIIYHSDVEKALRCGIEKRDIREEEWD